MIRVVKAIITVFVAIVSCFVCLVAAVACYDEIDFLDYTVAGEYIPTITDAKVEYLGKEYQGEAEDGFSYYRIYITLDNKSNFGKEDTEIYFMYDSESYEGNEWEYYSIMRLDSDTFNSYDDTAYYPAGKISTYSEVLCIADGCKGFEVYYSYYGTDDKQGIMVDL